MHISGVVFGMKLRHFSFITEAKIWFFGFFSWNFVLRKELLLVKDLRYSTWGVSNKVFVSSIINLQLFLCLIELLLSGQQSFAYDDKCPTAYVMLHSDTYYTYS